MAKQNKPKPQTQNPDPKPIREREKLTEIKKGGRPPKREK